MAQMSCNFRNIWVSFLNSSLAARFTVGHRVILYIFECFKAYIFLARGIHTFTELVNYRYKIYDRLYTELITIYKNA